MGPRRKEGRKMAYGATTFDRSKYNRMSTPRNAEPWGVYSPSGELIETWCTRARADERADELSYKWCQDYFVDRANRT